MIVEKFQKSIYEKYQLGLTDEQICMLLKHYCYNIEEAFKYCTRDKIREIAGNYLFLI